MNGVLDHPFVLHVLIRMIWCSELGLSEFLNRDDPHDQLDFAFSVVGAAVKLALHEQMSHPPNLMSSTRLDGKDTFDFILTYIRCLNDAQKAVFRSYKSHVVNVGEAQQASTGILVHLT